MVKPELPPNFEELDSDEKAFAIMERDKALLTKCYEAALVKNHLQSYLAFTRVDPAIRDLFTFCETTCKNGIIPLRDSLVQISENWGRMGLPHNCPYRVSDEELLRHTRELARYKNWHKLKSYAQELLQSDDDGWVAPQLDFEKVKARHAELFQRYIQKETEEISEEEAKSFGFMLIENQVDCPSGSTVLEILERPGHSGNAQDRYNLKNEKEGDIIFLLAYHLSRWFWCGKLLKVSQSLSDS
jgi:hypothetical protein